jgi:hypothetical protein
LNRRVKNFGRDVMTFWIDKVLVAVGAISLAGALCVSAKAQSANDSNNQTLAKSHSYRASATHSRKYIVSQDATHREPAVPQYYGWGGPPRQDSRDAYQGYFANPLDNPRYYGTGRATLIFRQ